MVPVGTARQGLAVGERLLDRLRIQLGASENPAPLRRCVREVFELDELRRLCNAGLRNRGEVAAPLGRIVLRLEGIEIRQEVHAARRG